MVSRVRAWAAGSRLRTGLLVVLAVAGMNVNVSDVNESIRELIRSR